MELTTKLMFMNSSKPPPRAAPRADERSRQASRQGLGQVQLHMIGGPSRDADTEEVHVLSPDRYSSASAHARAGQSSSSRPTRRSRAKPSNGAYVSKSTT